MRTVSTFVAIAIALTCSVGHAQTSPLAMFQGGGMEGIHLYSVNVFSSYVSSAYPLNTYLTVQPGVTQVGSDWSYGAGLTLGMSFQRDTRSFSLLYSGSYSESLNYKTSGFNQALSTSAGWSITPKWKVNVSASGQYQTLAEYLFEPTSQSILTQSSSSFDSLSAANSVGQPTDAQAAGGLTGTALGAASPLQSPAVGLLVGAHVLAYGGQVSMSYVASPRLTFHIAGVTAAGETSFGNTSQTSQPTLTLPHSIGLDGGASLNYEVSTRTTFGVQVDVDRNANRNQGAYASQAGVSLGRKMGENWFLRGSAGGAYTKVIQQAYGTPLASQFIGSASLGYKLSSQSFVVSYNRSTSDASGIAVGTSQGVSGTWSWRPLGPKWSVVTSVGDQKLWNTGFADFSGWTVSVGSGVHVVGNIMLSAQYVYANESGIYLGTQTKLSVNSARISIAWTPGWDRMVSSGAFSH